MSAHALADAGHSVYTSKRDTAGRHDSSNAGCEVVNVFRRIGFDDPLTPYAVEAPHID